ncbi:retrovirus-related pol polyprotein from transposon TNT 1-94 [Tanacetum coccineum]
MVAVNNVPQLVDKKGGSYAAIAPKLEPEKFNKAKPTKSLSQTYTRYKTLLNELANDGVNLSKHEINVGFVNTLPEKWLTFSQGLRNANHTQILDLADTYGMFDFQENSNDEIDERSSEEYLRDINTEFHKRALLENSKLSKGFQLKFTPKLIQSSQNSSSRAEPKIQKDYKAKHNKMKAKLALLEANSSTSQNPKTFQLKNKVLVAETVDWDEEEVSNDEEVTQVKVLMVVADNELTVGKNYARNDEWIDITMRKINILLSMDEDADWQNYLNYINIDLKFVKEQRLNLLSKYNKIVFELNKCRDELLVLKQAKLDAVTFQIQNTKLTKLNHALQEQLKEEKKINEKWLTSSKKVSQCISEQIPHQKKKVLGYDHEMVPKTKDWVERLNPDSRLPNFNTRRILVPESQAVNESLKPTETSNTPESSKDSKIESLTPLPPLKNLQGASPSSEVMPLTFQPHSPKERPGLGIMKHTKPETQDSLNKSVSGTVTVSETEPTTPLVPTEVKDTEQESKINELTKLVQMLIDEKVNSTQKTQESNSQIQQTESSKSVDSSKISQDSKPKVQNTGSSKSLRPKPIQKPQLKCELCNYTNHLTADCYRILYCMIYKKEDHRNPYHKMYTTSLKRNENYKAQPYQYASLSKMVENQKDVKVKQIRTDNGTEFRNHELESFCNEKEISQNSSSPYTLEQNGVAERKNKNLIEAARTMLNGSILSKHFWTEVVRITCYTQNRSIIVKRHDKTPHEIFRERIHDISYFHVFGCPVFIHNHKDHLGKFDVKADDGYFLGYSFVSKAFRVFNTRRQQVEETYHVTFDESMEAIRFTNTSEDETRIDDSYRYPPDEFIHEDDPSRQY